MNQQLESRLLNFKFKSALQYLESEPEEIKNLVLALNRMFSDSGWFNGDLAIITMYALEKIGVHFDADE